MDESKADFSMAFNDSPASNSIFDSKYSSDEIRNKNWRQLPNVLSMRFSEWIASLTHPKTGAFPKGVSPKLLDRLAHNQITQMSKDKGEDVRPVWKSNNHLGVMLWNEVKAGRVIRVSKACYVGAQTRTNKKSAQNGQAESTDSVATSSQKSAENAVIDDVVETVRNKRLQSTSKANVTNDNASNCSTTATSASKPPQQDSSPAQGEASSQQEFQCRMCNTGLDATGKDGTLKCIECYYQTHMNCAYPNDTIPTNLQKRLPSAIAKWRCYDCKRCHLCGRKDDLNDGLLLCDGCDAGEHMGCQNPPLQDVPPAPWFCSQCRLPPAAAALPVDSPNVGQTEINIEKTKSAESETVIIDDHTESSNKKQSIDTIPSLDCPSSQSEPDSSAQVQSASMLPLSAWSRDAKTSPPLSDETPDVVQQQEARQSPEECTVTAVVMEDKTVRTRLGKRKSDAKWSMEEEEEQELSAPTRNRRRRTETRLTSTRSAIAQLLENEAQKQNNGTNDNAHKYEIGSRFFRKDKEETDLLPFMSEDLPLLNDEDAKCIQGAKLWSVDDTAAFLTRMGFPESAKAFSREEIDGAALLLLRRHDVLMNLGLKLGPALKTYKFVRYIQATVRSS